MGNLNQKLKTFLTLHLVTVRAQNGIYTVPWAPQLKYCEGQKNYQSCQIPIKANLTTSNKKTSASEWIWSPPATWKAGSRESWEGMVGGEMGLSLQLGKKGGGSGKRDLWLAAFRRDVFLPLHTWSFSCLFMALGQAKWLGNYDQFAMVSHQLPTFLDPRNMFEHGIRNTLAFQRTFAPPSCWDGHCSTMDDPDSIHIF